MCVSTLIFTQVIDLPSFILSTWVAKNQLNFAQSFCFFFAKENTVLEVFTYRKGRTKRTNVRWCYSWRGFILQYLDFFQSCGIAMQISPWPQWRYSQLRTNSGLLSSGHFTRPKPQGSDLKAPLMLSYISPQEGPDTFIPYFPSKSEKLLHPQDLA